MSTNGVGYAKSMNGIVSFNDGSGTVIQDGIIITNELDATNFNTNNIQGIQPSDNITLYTNSTGDIHIGSTNSLNYVDGPLYVDNILGTTTGTAFIYPNVVSDVNLGSSTIPIIGQYTCTQPTHLANKSYVDSKVGVNLLPLANTWTGTSNTFNNKIVVDIINASSPFLYISLYGNVTNSIQLGAGMTTGGILSLGPYMTSGNINIGAEATFANPGSPTISIGNDFGSSSVSLRTLGTVNLGTKASTINIGTTTGTTIGIGSTTSNVTVNSSALSLDSTTDIDIKKPLTPSYGYVATNGLSVSNQIGYTFYNTTVTGGTFLTNTITTVLSLTNIPAGIWFVYTVVPIRCNVNNTLTYQQVAITDNPQTTFYALNSSFCNHNPPFPNGDAWYSCSGIAVLTATTSLIATIKMTFNVVGAYSRFGQFARLSATRIA